MPTKTGVFERRIVLPGVSWDLVSKGVSTLVGVKVFISVLSSVIAQVAKSHDPSSIKDPRPAGSLCQVSPDSLEQKQLGILNPKPESLNPRP